MKKIKTILNENITKINKIDILLIGIIILLYSLLSFYHLGDKDAPNTFFRRNANQYIDIELEEETDIHQMMIFNGEENSKIKIYMGNDKENLEYLKEIEPKMRFSWNKIRIGSKGKIIRLYFINNTSIGEIALYQNKKLLPITSKKYKELFDEQNTIPEQISYQNTSYFDETYFATTAYQYVYNLNIYEWTHPPLGKIIQAIPIYITHKMNPWNYRIMGNISGILLILVMYFYGAVLFQKRKYALTSAIFMSLDTFHFAHTRMGTVDSHLVLAMTLASLMMIFFIKNKKNIYLLLSGILFGISICIKWTAFYGGIALAILYFIYLIIQKKVNIAYIVRGIVYFVMIPISLYIGVFLIFSNNFYRTNTLTNIIKNQEQMYEYHANLEERHFFSSKWYTWPLSLRPVWYHEQEITENTKETISGVGNIIIWIGSLFGIVYSVYKFIKEKDKSSLIIIISFLSLWIPFVFIHRVMFLYHFFPALPFYFMALVNLLKDMEEKYQIKNISFICIICSLVFFLIYYPVISGKEISKNYADNLELIYSWYF